MNKPSGAECTIDCDYCFYLHKTDLLEHKPHARMDDPTLEQHIRQYIESQTGEQVVFSWQGGEPTLMGLPFYERVVELQAKYAKPGQRIENDLQTNGIALDDAWIAFLKINHFHVGLSIDGPRELHDRYRKTRNNKPTFDLVMSAARKLVAADVSFAALCVVNRANAKHPKEVYRFLVDEVGSWRVQFNPAVEPRAFKESAPGKMDFSSAPLQDSARAKPGHPLSIVTDWSVDPDDYGTFLSGVWDEWLATDFGRIHVNLFETAIAQAAGMPAQTCTQAEFCGKGLAVEHDGGVVGDAPLSAECTPAITLFTLNTASAISHKRIWVTWHFLSCKKNSGWTSATLCPSSVALVTISNSAGVSVQKTDSSKVVMANPE